jgi:5-methylcytosine-specific restriction endonuclease McrA
VAGGLRRCLGCGVLIRGRSRCSVCRSQTERARSRGWVWSTRIVPMVLERDGHRCVLCGRPCPHPRHHHVDHIVPVLRGGSDALDNLRTVCAAFNLGGRCDGRQ